jgi:hypothetical protein
MMKTRHITLSRQQGMITELELMGAGFGKGERYMLRYHRPISSTKDALDFGASNVPGAIWTGFRYRDDQISVLLQRQGRSSAAA